MINWLITGPFRAQFFATVYTLIALAFGWLGYSVLSDHFSREPHERESVGVLGGLLVLGLAVAMAVLAVQTLRGVVR